MSPTSGVGIGANIRVEKVSYFFAEISVRLISELQAPKVGVAALFDTSKTVAKQYTNHVRLRWGKVKEDVERRLEIVGVG